MKNNKKQLKNKKHYFGNALTNAFFPILASLGLTLGATCYTITTKKSSSDSGEISKTHEIEIIQPSLPEQKGWTLNCTTPSGEKKAKKGDKVIFSATEDVTSNDVSKKPIGVKINEQSLYEFDTNLQVEVQIKFIEKMKVELAFPDGKDEHSVTFDLGYDPEQGSRCSKVAVQHNEKCSKPLNPARDNYVFQYWKDVDSGNEFDFENTPITTNVTLEAQWKDSPQVESHTIHINDPSEQGWSVSCDAPQEAGEYKAKKDDHVKFTVQSTATLHSKLPYGVQLNEIIFPLILESSETQTYSVDIKIPFAVDMVATVLFEIPSTKIVSFDSQGGSVIDPIEVQYQGKVSKPTQDPTKTGHTFVRWYLNDENTPFDFENTLITTNITLKAKWSVNSYTVTFKNWDGSVVETPKQIQFGTMPTKPAKDPTRTKTDQYTYEFVGWEPALHPVTAGTAETDNVYTAVYEATTNEYTVNFETNGGTTVLDQKIKYGDKVDKLKLSTTKIGYKDPVWYEDSTLQTPWDFNKPITGKTTLYCGWTIEEYNIEFVNYNKEQLAIQSTKYNTTPEYKGPTPTKPDTEGQAWAWSGWTPTLVPATGPATYTATFVESKGRKTVTFDTNGGSFIQPQLVEWNKKITKPTNPEKTGSKFVGWYKDSALQTPWDFENDVVTDNMSLYAKWDVAKFKITFEDTYGTQQPQVFQDVQYNTVPAPSLVPTRTDATGQYSYKFKCWINKDTKEEGIKPATSEVTYIPKFDETVNQYTITFDVNGAVTPITSITKEYGSTISKPIDPTYEGHKLIGWYYDNGGAKTKWVFEDEATAEDPATQIKSNITLKADWEIEKYTITFKDDSGNPIEGESKQWEYNAQPSCSVQPEKSNPQEHHTYQFVGWKEESDPTGTVGIKLATKNTIYVPVYNDVPEFVYCVTLVLNGGTGKTVVYVAPGGTLPSSCEPTRPEGTDYDFGGWFRDENFSDGWNIETDVVTSNITLYAEWVPPYANENLFGIDNNGVITSCSTSVPNSFSIPNKINGKTVTAIGDKVFCYYATSGQPRPFNKNTLTEVHLPYTVTKLGQYCFSDQTNITKLSMINVNYFTGTTVTSQTEGCLYNVKNLKDIKIVTKTSLFMGKWCLFGCNSLENFTCINYDSSTQTTVYLSMYSFYTGRVTNVYFPYMSQTTYFGDQSLNSTGALNLYCLSNTIAEMKTMVNATPKWGDDWKVTTNKIFHCKDGDWNFGS